VLMHALKNQLFNSLSLYPPIWNVYCSQQFLWLF